VTRALAALAALAALGAATALAACDTDLWLGNLRAGLEPSDLPDAASLPDAPLAAPCVLAAPDRVDFRDALMGQSVASTVSLHNRCDSPRAITGFYLGGDRGFSVVIGGVEFALTPRTGTEGVRFDPPLVIRPGETLEVAVRFEPTAPELARASVIWLTDDPGGGPTVQMVANSRPPACIATLPKSVDFGPVIVGTERQRTLRVGSCGSAALALSTVTLEGPDAASFSLTPPAYLAVPPAPDGLDLELRFHPSQTAPRTLDDRPPAARAELVIGSNAFHSSLRVPISAVPVAAACPWPVISGAVPATLTVGDSVTLDSAQSLGVLAPVDRRAWSAAGPEGSRAFFAPSADATAPSVRLDTVGTWTLTLAVWDSEGRPGCVVAQRVIQALPPATGVHLQLTWTTPGDLDPTDRGPGAGSDIDLHLRHPFATGQDIDGDGQLDGWFDLPFDVHWLNPTPDWGQVGDASDNPRLVLDDTDGEGPETIDLPPSAAALSYTIGAHSWNDHGYGVSVATLRAWLDGAPLGEPVAFELSPDRFCTVATLELPGGLWLPSPTATCADAAIDLVKPAW
jgi:hypothetical protein